MTDKDSNKYNSPATSKSVVSKTTDGGERILKIVASTMSIDRDLEIVHTPSLKIPKIDGNTKLPFLIDHDHRIQAQIGVIRDAYVDDNGDLVEEVHIAKGIPAADNFWKLVEQDMLGNSFSIGFIPDFSEIEGNMYKEAELIETSAVFLGSNRDARLITSKKLTDSEWKELDMSTKVKGNKTQEELAKELEEANAKIKELESQEDEAKKEADEAAKKEAEEAEAAKAAEKEAEEAAAKEKAEKESKEEEGQKMTEADIKKMIDKGVAATVKGLRAEGGTSIDKQLEIASQEDHQTRFAKQMTAFATKDFETVRRYSMANAKIKGQDFTADLGGVLVYPVEVDRDIERCRAENGVLSALVKRRTLTGAREIEYKKQTQHLSFSQIDPSCGEIPAGEMKFESKRVGIAKWGVQDFVCNTLDEDTINVWYDDFVQDVGQALAILEDTIIMKQGDTTVDGTTYDASGITHTNFGANALAGVYDATLGFTLIDVVNSVAKCARESGAYVMTHSTWNKVKTQQAADGHYLFGSQQEILTMRTIDGRPVITVDDAVLDNDLVVYGDFSRYTLLQKGGLTIQTSQDAIVKDIAGTEHNMWMTDQTAMRALVRRYGYSRNAAAFAVITLT